MNFSEEEKEFIDFYDKMGDGKIPYNPNFYLVKDYTQEGAADSNITLVSPTEAQVNQAKMQLKRKLVMTPTPVKRRRIIKAKKRKSKKKTTMKKTKGKKSKRKIKKRLLKPRAKRLKRYKGRRKEAAENIVINISASLYFIHFLICRRRVNMSATTNELALFQAGAVERGVNDVDWINFRPIGQIGKGSPIEFQVPGTSSEYISLAKTRLHVKVRILRPNGTQIDNTDDVSLTNLCLHSLFRQVDIALQQQVISSTTGINYSYKSYLDVMLKYGHNELYSLLQAEGMYKDERNYMSDSTGNVGHLNRKKLTQYGIADFESVLHVDLAQQDKCILNGVQIGVTLFQNDDNFRLFTTNGQPYEVEIVDAVLKVCHVKVNPSVVVSHNERLKKSPAIYPYWKSDIKTFGIASGSYTFSTDDIFHGYVPDKLIVAFVLSEAYSGDYSKNPFDFQHFNLNFLELSVDGRSVPTIPFQPQYQEVTTEAGTITPLSTGYVHEYLSLFKNDYPQNGAFWITRDDFAGGYAIYVFDIKPGTDGKLFSKIKRGHTRLSARFGSGLLAPVNVITYGIFPSEFRIDQTRNILT